MCLMWSTEAIYRKVETFYWLPQWTKHEALIKKFKIRKLVRTPIFTGKPLHGAFSTVKGIDLYRYQDKRLSTFPCKEVNPAILTLTRNLGFDQSESSILTTWLLTTNQRAVFWPTTLDLTELNPFELNPEARTPKFTFIAAWPKITRI